MSVVGEKENIGPAFGKSVHIDLNGAQITPADGFLLLREVDERLGLFEQTASGIEEPRPARRTDHSLFRFLRRGVYRWRRTVSTATVPFIWE